MICKDTIDYMNSEVDIFANRLIDWTYEQDTSSLKRYLQRFIFHPF